MHSRYSYLFAPSTTISMEMSWPHIISFQAEGLNIYWTLPVSRLTNACVWDRLRIQNDVSDRYQLSITWTIFSILLELISNNKIVLHCIQLIASIGFLCHFTERQNYSVVFLFKKQRGIIREFFVSLKNSKAIFLSLYRRNAQVGSRHDMHNRWRLLVLQIFKLMMS